MSTRVCTFTLLLVSLAAGCTAQRLPPDSRGVSFPVESATYLKEGAFIAPVDIGLIKPGLSKDQVQLVLGLPHFTEGLAGVRDWNYRFNFYTGKDKEYVTCQYQVQYDEQERVKATYWKTPECESLATVKPPEPVVVEKVVVKEKTVVTEKPVAAPAVEKTLTLSSDVLFPFARSSPLSVEGRQALTTLAASLKKNDADKQITVTGHADRIGDAERNRALSLARAQTVADFLVSQGIARERVKVMGKGSGQPVSQCAQGRVTPELVRCLAPDRRVTITVHAAS